MRENDDVTSGTSGGSLADGLGETAVPGGGSSSGPFGGGDADDSYGDGTGSQVDDTYDDDSYDDDAYGDDAYGDADGSFGDGDLTDVDSDSTVGPADDVTGDLGDDDLGDDDLADAGLDGVDLPSQDASPIEGVGYLIDQVRDALFGTDDDAAGSVLDADPLAPGLGTEPADLATETDLDLTGDGVVDHGDLLEAERPFDFDAGGG